mgnify:CR=1 FL=1
MVKIRFFHVVLLSLVILSGFHLYQIYQANRSKSAASTTTQLDLNVMVGSLSQNISSDVEGDNEVKLDPVNILMANASGIDTSGDFNTYIRDHRGLAIGWSQTVSCADFISGTDIIPVSHLTIVPTSVTPLGISNPTGVHLGATHTFVDSADTTTIVKADSGYGQGRFDIYNLLHLHLDQDTPVGTYTSTMTVTIS